MASPRILIVDDEVALSWHWIAPLVRRDYFVDNALSGEMALRMLAERRYEVVILDLLMPNISGADVLRAIRDGKTQNGNIGTPETVKVLVWSVYDNPREIALGADAYCSKVEFSPTSLLREIERLLS